MKERSLQKIIDHSLDLRQNVITAIEAYDSASKSLEEEDPPDDQSQGSSQEELRQALKAELAGKVIQLLSEDKDILSPSVYEEAVLHTLLCRISRYMGYYMAISRASDELHRRNTDLGDSALSMDFNSLQRLLMGMDEVQFVRELGLSIGMESSDLESIVSRVLRKEFKVDSE